MTTDEQRVTKVSMVLTPSEAKLIEAIRLIGWASIEKITIQNGQPQMLTVNQTYKLT